MSERNDPLRHILDGLVAMPSPTADQVESARRALTAAIEGNIPREPVRPKLRVGMVAAAVLALVIAFTAVAPWGRTPAGAWLAELAEATRSIPPEDLPPGSYVYFAVDQLAFADNAAPVDEEIVRVQYLIPSHSEYWWQDDTVRREITVGTPIFFDPDMEAFYYDSDLDEAEFVGETRIDVLTGVSNQINPSEWSDDPDVLADQLQEAAQLGEHEYPTEVRMVELAAELLTPNRLASPSLRAAILEVLATLDLEETQLSDGGVSASVTYDERYFGTVTAEFTFDDQGYLVQRQLTTLTGDDEGLLPPGTVFLRITQTPPSIVPEPGVRPGDAANADAATPPTVTSGAHLELGTTYRYRYYVHCGMEWLLDFSGRNWITDGPIYNGIGRLPEDLREFVTDPNEQISPEMWVYVTLISEEEIRLSLPDGSQESVYHPTDVQPPGCA